MFLQVSLFFSWATQWDHICFHSQLKVSKQFALVVSHVRSRSCSPLMTKVTLHKLITNLKVLGCDSRGWGVSYIPYTNKKDKSQQFTSQVSQYSSKWLFCIPLSFLVMWNMDKPLNKKVTYKVLMKYCLLFYYMGWNTIFRRQG